MPRTKILFMETRTEEKRSLLCRLVELLYEVGAKVQVSVDSTLAAQHLDQLLWTFSQGSFVPHRVVSAAASQPAAEPVVIAVGATPLAGCEVVVADGPVQLESMAQYRLAVHFILMDDPEQRQESRLLWQSAKEQGFHLQHIPYSANLNSIRQKLL